MSSGALAHRSVASIRAVPPQGQTPSSPHTPPSRVASSSYGSPSTIRADDDFVLIEIGSRFVRVGFAGDALPKAVLSCGPAQACRVGDYRAWQQPPPPPADAWSDEYELWCRDTRNADLGLFHDKLDRLLRDAFTRYLLIDSRPRKMGLILETQAPMPFLSTVLDTLFHNFQTPMVSLMSSPTMSAAAAGVRSALVIDMGWAETVVSSVYEYREIKTTRTVRAGRHLLDGLHSLLRQLLLGGSAGEAADENEAKVVSFEECEDILCRLVWCRASACKSSQRQSAQLDTVEEQDESDGEPKQVPGAAEIPLRSTNPPSTLSVPFERLADVCDDSFFGPSPAPPAFDDHELPVHMLVYRHLLQLPVDARAVCMARVMFQGGCSNILGIKERIMDEVAGIVDRRGWAPASGKAVDQLRNKQKLRRASTQRSSVSSTATADSSGEDQDGARSESSGPEPAGDIEAKIARNRPVVQQMQGHLRALHTLGPWAGASLVCQLKIPALATIERDLWLQQGPGGACRPSEVDAKAQQRQSVGAGGLIRSGGGHHASWTLGIWGPY